MHRAESVGDTCQVDPFRGISLPLEKQVAEASAVRGRECFRRVGHVFARARNLRFDILRGQGQEAPDVFSQTQVSLGFPAYTRLDVDVLASFELLDSVLEHCAGRLVHRLGCRCSVGGGARKHLAEPIAVSERGLHAVRVCHVDYGVRLCARPPREVDRAVRVPVRPPKLMVLAHFRDESHVVLVHRHPGPHAEGVARVQSVPPLEPRVHLVEEVPVRGVVEVGPGGGPVCPGCGVRRPGSDGSAAVDEVGCERLECSTAGRRCDCRLRVEVSDGTDVANARQLVAEGLSNAYEQSRDHRREQVQVVSVGVAPPMVVEKKDLVPMGQWREQTQHLHPGFLPAVTVGPGCFPYAIGALDVRR